VSGLKALKESPLTQFFSENAKGVVPVDLSKPAPVRENSEPK
jgi:hypothetical protein